MKKLSIVVPCFNEEAVLPETTRQLTSLLDVLIRDKQISENIYWPRSIIIVDGIVASNFYRTNMINNNNANKR